MTNLLFENLPYERINIDKLRKEVDDLFLDFENKPIDKKEFIIRNYFQIMDHVNSSFQLAMIKHSINVNDEFYKKENVFIDENSAFISQIDDKISRLINSSKDIDKLKKIFGNFYFEQISNQLKLFKDELIPLIQKENSYTTKYDILTANAKVNYEGKDYNLSEMGKFLNSLDREIRKNASNAINSFYEKNQDEFDTIYDELVKIRNEKSKILGFNNFAEQSLFEMNRFGYNFNDIKTWRNEIKKYVLPLAKELVKEQKIELNLDKIYNYDLPVVFKDGNPKPEGNPEELVSAANKMYHLISKETGAFFNMMKERKLLDLLSKDGKVGGGFCDYISEFKAPFIFANFNGTSGDVDVLTHEAGHAFQVYTAKDLIPPYRWPSYEGAEVFSMAMEFFAYPYMNLFFKNESKYKYYHLRDGLMFLLYGALVDEFQEEIYKNPNLTKEERLKLFRKLELEYLPYKEYENEFLNKGTFWYRQGHIFASPFYYIDYTLAQFIALQFFILDNKNHKKAWNKYYNLCHIAGSVSFLDLIKKGKLINPFTKNSFKKIIKPIISKLKEYKNNI